MQQWAAIGVETLKEVVMDESLKVKAKRKAA
jgi:hypothetical protein